jgi:pilus assembly protein CpaB
MDATEIAAALSRATRLVGGHRRIVAAALAGVAVLAGLSAARPRPIPTAAVWVAAHDLPGGQPLAAADVALRRFPLADLPGGALSAADRVVGRLLAAPVRQGEPMTDVRLLDPALLAALGRPGLVAVPVRLSDGAAAAALVHAGDRVDILATDDVDGHASGPPRTVAASVTVLSVPAGGDAATGDGGGLLIVAVTAAQAGSLAQAAGGSRLSVTLVRR